MSEREGMIHEDEYDWQAGARRYRVFSLTESEIDALVWAPVWTRRAMVKRIKAETDFTPDVSTCIPILATRDAIDDVLGKPDGS